MIKHSIKENIIHVSIEKTDFSYRIPIEKLGRPIKWTIGAKGTEGIVMKNVSSWTLQLFTKNVTDEKLVLQFKDLVQEHAPKNSVDWKETLEAVKVQNEYNRLKLSANAGEKKMTEEELIAHLEEKFSLA
jgi:hypothetical protein